MKRFFCGLLICIFVLAGCSAKNEIMHEFKDEQSNASNNENKVIRLDSFSQGEIYLKGNSAYPVEDVEAGYCLLFEYNGEDNPVILCKNAYMSFQPSFLTRIFASSLAVSECDIYDKISVPNEVYQVDSSLDKCNILPGDELRIIDLIAASTIYGKADTMVPMAFYISGSIEEFNNKLSSYILDIGCEQTKIADIYGKDSSDQYTNIYDLYIGLPKLLKQADLYNILCSQTYTCTYTTGTITASMTMPNQIPYFYEKMHTASGLSIIGGVCNSKSDKATDMLIIAKDSSDRTYVAFVGGCKDYEQTKEQMELILCKISN